MVAVAIDICPSKISRWIRQLLMMGTRCEGSRRDSMHAVRTGIQSDRIRIRDSMVERWRSVVNEANDCVGSTDQYHSSRIERQTWASVISVASMLF